MGICSVEGCELKTKAKGLCNPHFLRWKRNGDPVARKRREKGAALKWLDEHVTWSDKDECLIWNFHVNHKGYPDWNGELIHRRMCKLAHGEPPTPKHHAAHSCGNGKGGCVNPNHLRWATAKENSEDNILHGKTWRGEQSPFAKLTREQVMVIRATPSYYGYIQDLKRQYPISEGGIRAIRQRRSWAWLPEA